MEDYGWLHHLGGHHFDSYEFSNHNVLMMITARYTRYRYTTFWSERQEEQLLKQSQQNYLWQCKSKEGSLLVRLSAWERYYLSLTARARRDTVLLLLACEYSGPGFIWLSHVIWDRVVGDCSLKQHTPPCTVSLVWHWPVLSCVHLRSIVLAKYLTQKWLRILTWSLVTSVVWMQVQQRPFLDL